MKKAQSVIEYTVLIITIAAAFIAMSLYLQRAANQRLRDIEQENNPGIIVEDAAAPAGAAAAGAPPGSGSLPPEGWRDTDAGREYCDRSGLCYPEEWMQQPGVTINEDGIVVSEPGVSISPQ